MSVNVIILNGVSSSGKTTLAKAIQKYSHEIWLHVAMDSFIAMLPDGREFDREWFPLIEVTRESAILPQITNGPSGEALFLEMRRLVRGLSETGFNVIVDEVAQVSAIADYRARLGDNCLVVKVDAPLSELERREKERGDRIIGLAREQSDRVHNGISYDLEVDTHGQTPDALARQILERIAA